MNKTRIKALVNQLGIPVMITLVGLLLLAKPDSAAALVAKIIGWLLVIGGAVKAISMASKPSASSVGTWIAAAACVVLGVALLYQPLLLATSLGRFLGLLLFLRGLGGVKNSVNQKAQILAIINMVAGIVLFLVPMTLTRTLLRLCGAVIALIGIVNIVEKLQEMKLLESGSDSNIIDADE